MQSVKVKNFLIGEKQPLTIFCGPCVIESEYDALKAAEELKEIFSHFPFQYIFKSSFDKANRSSIDSFRGPGMEKGLLILEKIKNEFDLPILTDIHLPSDASMVKDVCDIIQIPAFLCRQTDLLVAAGNTQKPINVKKGQFVSPYDMKHAIEKIKSTNNNQILLTDRGTFFGYNNLVSDMRSILIMQELGCPVCYDATHSIQLPGGNCTTSGGERQFIPPLAKAAIAAGANALYLEAHPKPELGKCDSASMIAFTDLKVLLREIEMIYTTMQNF